MTTKIILKKSSVSSNAPSTGDLDYGEFAINYADGKLYYKNSSNVIKNFSDSDTVQAQIAAAVAEAGGYNDASVDTHLNTGTANTGEVLSWTGSDYDWVVQSGGLDSAAVVSLVDSAYVQLRQDYAYSSLTGTPSIPQSGVDFDPVGTDNSTDVTLAGSYDYLTLSGQQITLNQIDYSTDISNLPNILDSADVAAVASEAGYYSSGDSAVFSTVTTTGNVVIGGDLQVNGTTVTVNATDLNVTDNMIYMNAGESDGSPVASIDVGWAANVNDNGSYAHVGMFRDATDDTFKVFHNYIPEPDAAVEINTGHASFALAPFAASTLSGTYLGFDSDFSSKSTTDLTEGTNLYYTSSRVDSDILSYGYTTCLGTVTSVSAGTGLTGGPITTTGSLSLATAGAGAANYTGGISAVNVDAYGRVTSVSGSAGYTTCTGTVTSVTVSAGTGLSGGGTVTTSGTATLNLDFSELTDKTTDITGTTEFILQDGTTESRKAANEIKLSNFVNDVGWTSYDSADTIGLVDSDYVQARQDYAYTSLTGTPNVLDSANVSSIVTSYGYTTCVGTVTSATVSAGTGLSGGGTITSSGTVTLNLDFAELTDMTGDISGTTEFILQNGTTESRKAASEIKLSNFNNDAGWTAYDSINTLDLIDSAYVQLKAVGLDYNVLSNKPAAGGLDSAAAIALMSIDNLSDGSTAGTRNVALGTNAGTGQAGNTTVGFEAGCNLSAANGDQNVFLGTYAGKAFSVADHQVGIGYGAMCAGTSVPFYNVAVGSWSMKGITGGCNTALGAYSMCSSLGATCNTAVGYSALRNNTTGTNNVAVGADALLANTTGGCNVAVGVCAGYTANNTYGVTAIGYHAGKSNTTGKGNTLVGYIAGCNIQNGQYNTIMGAWAGCSGTSAGYVTAIGQNALRNNTVNYSTAVGWSALQNNSTGSGNVAMGPQALYVNTTGSQNVAFGACSLCANTTGAQNTVVGSSAGSTLTTGSNVTAIGYNAQPSSATASNEITLGDANITSFRIPGLQAGATTGDILTYDGSKLVLSAPSGGGSSSWVTKTANYTASNGDRIVADTTGGTFTITLPATPSAGDQVTIADGGDFSVTNLTVGRNGSTIEGTADDVTIDIKDILVDFVYDSDATWQIYTQGLISNQYGILDDSSSIMYPAMVYHDSDTSGFKITSNKFSFDASSGTLSVTDLNSTSDVSLKENINVINNAIDKVKSINGVSFKWKDNKRSAVGVIAQEVEKVLPELVDTNARGEKSVKYNGIIGLLVEAVKEQQKTIDELKRLVNKD